VVVVVVAVAALGGLALYLSSRGDESPAQTTETPRPPEPTPAQPPVPPIPSQPPTPLEPVYEPAFGLQPHASEHYVLYSSAPEALKADVTMRLEALHAELQREMADVFAPYDDKAKAFFIGDPDLFVEAGGEPHAPGVFRVLVDQDGNPVDGVGPRLVLRNSGNAIYLEITSLMQHEGWHQFNWHHVRQWAPIWLDEGLGHHYQYSVWTGDTMIHGGIHGSVMQLLLQSAPSFISLRDLLTLDDANWRAWQEQAGFWPPYMESWSLIHFLKYVNGGAHEPLLRAYLADVAAGRDTTASAEAIMAMENDWLQWLGSLQPTNTHVKFFEAIAAMLAGHLARCHINGQDFETIADLLAANEAGMLELGPIGSDTWLPASVMGECVRYMKMYGDAYAASGYGPFEVNIEMVNGLPTVRLTLVNLGLNLHAAATVSGGKVIGVKVAGLETAQAAMR
jgi:hypothetical protein